MEVRYKIESQEVEFLCPECNKGHLKPTGKVLLTNPPKFLHKCEDEHCGYEKHFKIKYPYIEHIRVLEGR